MSRFHHIVALGSPLVIVCLLVASAGAQNQGGRGQGRRGPGAFGGVGGFGGGGDIGLLRSQQVQKDLELVDDQKQAITKLGEDMRKKMQDSLSGLSQEDRRAKMRSLMEENQKEAAKQLDGILLPQQKDRLKEISLQVRGTAALTDKDVASQLKLSDDQQQKLKQISEDTMKELRDAFSGGGGGDRQAARDKVTKLRSDARDKALAVLNPEQRDQFAKMQGKIIEIDRSQFGRGGGGGRQGRRGGNSN